MILSLPRILIMMTMIAGIIVVGAVILLFVKQRIVKELLEKQGIQTSTHYIIPPNVGYWFLSKENIGYWNRRRGIVAVSSQKLIFIPLLSSRIFSFPVGDIETYSLRSKKKHLVDITTTDKGLFVVRVPEEWEEM